MSSAQDPGTALAEEAPVAGPRPPRAEIRFGLVLYGGVSLAVYIYGVVLEFWRLARASRGAEGNAYDELLRQAEAQVAIDIVSGASAGGINGLLLGRALACGADLAAVRALWLDRADLGELLRPSSDKEPRSLLRSEQFESLLLQALDDMDAAGDGARLVDVFDYFAPGTRLRAAPREFRTDLGQIVRTREYRKRFHLRFRRSGYNPADRRLGYDRNDFAPDRNPLVVEVARATSAFPAAFDPMLIERAAWNAEQFSAEEPARAFFSDGGILHNRPFTDAIDTILTRAADRPVQRWLLSVEPDPEHYLPPTGAEQTPEVVDVVAKALSGIPRYQSIVADLERLGSHRERAVRLRELLRGVEGVVAGSEIVTAPEPGARLQEQLLYAAYLPLRTAVLRERVTSIVADAVGVAEEDLPWLEDQVQGYLSELSHERSIDAPYERRRVYHLLELAGPALAAADAAVREPFRLAYLRLWACFDRLLDAEWRAGRAAVQAGEAEGRRGDLQALVAAVCGSLEQSLPAIRHELDEAAAAFDEAANATLAADVLERARPVPLTRVAARFEVWDMFLLPLETVSGLGARDPIRWARISPADPHYIRKAIKDKLAGDTFGHFGGFLKREWRANDLLWGRLDAAEMIVRTVLEGAATEDEEPLVRAVQEEIVADELGEVPGDYRIYLENAYRVGSESLADVPSGTRVTLAWRGAEVLRNMLRGLGKTYPKPALKRLYRTVGRILGTGLALFKWPTLSIWASDRLSRRTAGVVIAVVAGWGVISLVAVLVFDLFEPTTRFWIAVGISFAPLVVAAFLRMTALAREREASRGGESWRPPQPPE